MSIPESYRVIQPARAGTITDDALNQAITAANAIDNLTATSEQITLFMLTAGPLMRECRQWRKGMSAVQGECCDDNVVPLLRS